MRAFDILRGPFADAVDQMGAELRLLDHMLARHVARLRASGAFNEDPLRGLYIGEAEALAALDPPQSCDADADIALLWAARDARAARSPNLTLQTIARCFGLDGFEQAALIIAAAPALERRYRTLFAYAQNDVAQRRPSVDLILALLLDDAPARLRHLARFAPEAALRRGGLLRWAANEEEKPLAERALAVDDRVALALIGADCGMDERLEGFTRVVEEPPPLDDDKLLARIVAVDNAALIVFEGPADAGQARAAAALCASERLGLIEADLDHPAAGALPPALLGRLLAREALLRGAGLFVSTQGGGEAALVAAAQLRPRLFASSACGALELAALADALCVARIVAPRADAAARAGWWRAALAPEAGAEAAGLAQASRIGPRAIARAVATAGNDPAALRAAVDLHAATRLPGLAQRVGMEWDWDDLVLAERPRAQLDELAETLRHWALVTGEWGFTAKRNCVALFTGPSGTGKTMAAGLVARAASQALWRVDLSQIFDKYIGETEKRLDRVFAAAADAGAALLFDESDALFGKRTALKDAHDRYANLNVAYLLQRIETHDGLAILTTNLPANLDTAFARRLAHVVAFPMPGEAERRRLWARAFPAQAPLGSDLALDAVAATFEISGGSIRNAAFAAACLAAGDDGVIRGRHLMRALARELEKIGRPPIAADYGALDPGT